MDLRGITFVVAAAILDCIGHEGGLDTIHAIHNCEMELIQETWSYVLGLNTSAPDDLNATNIGRANNMINPPSWPAPLDMPSLTKLLPSCLTALLLSGNALSTKVTLPYGTFVGLDNYTSDLGSPLPNPLVAYLHIPYAAPPTGARRFARPQPPLQMNGTVSSTEYGPICPQSGTSKMDEDCLSLAVFAPKGTTTSDKLPVVIWIHGGAFNSGSKQAFSLASMISHSPVKYIGVSINYRQIASTSDFTTSNMQSNGSRSNILIRRRSPQVTLFGESAGATSVGYHLLHVDGPPPFKRVIMDSGGPTARAFPDWTYPLYQTQTDEFLNLTGCYRGANETATFSCLRGISMETIRNASVSVNLAPKISDSQLDTVANLYPGPDVPGSPYANSSFSPSSRVSQQLMVTLHSIIAKLSQRGVRIQIEYPSLEVPLWLLDADADPALGLYTLRAVIRERACSFQVLWRDAEQSKIMNAYWSSYSYFLQSLLTGNPNKASSLAPVWPRYTLQNEIQIRFSNGTAYTEPDNIRRNATDFWQHPGCSDALTSLLDFDIFL
ncbi:type-B carboxylesterase lipase family [Rhizoctonia solani]|uniref:Type-B carboxylesterase lipase family n=1 Tax=Rhizoctonia solani TaxID=456999 RepID=A0A8H7I8Z6_9AGAM|nr:type-B carboxylesterase lipase family [Rhizoctonia solani]